jgi:hypothetical protein
MNKQIVVVVVLMMVTLVFSNTITVVQPSMAFSSTNEGISGRNYEDLSTEEKEEWVKKYLDMGDTISETLDGVAVTKEDREKSEYLSDLYEEMLEQQKEDKEEMQEKKEKEEFKKTVQFPDTTERDVERMCGATEDFEENEAMCRDLYQALKDGRIPDDPSYEYD